MIPSSSNLRSGARSGLLHAAREAMHGLVQELAYRRASRALSGFDDAGLHDLGLARSDIETAVRHGRTGARG